MAVDARWGLGRAHKAQGDLEQAIDDFEALAAERVVPATLSPLLIAGELTHAYSECGDLNRAVEVGEQALAEAVGQGAKDDAVSLVSTLVGCYYERGDLTRAHQLARTTLATADAAGSPVARASALWNASLVEEARGDLRTARAYADRALALFSESDNMRAVALLRIVAAWLLLREQEPALEDAEDLLGRALDELRTVGSPVDAAYGETELARCRLLGGDWLGAIDIAERSLSHLGESSRIEAARARLVIGHARLVGGDTRAAIESYAQAGADLRAFGAHRQAAAAWRELAEALAGIGRAEDALDAYRQASDAAGVSKAPEQVVMTRAAAPLS
jgi:tetratricopeptide (TPR) repeat protein